MSLIPALGKQRQKDLCEFKVIPDDTPSSKNASGRTKVSLSKTGEPVSLLGLLTRT